MNSSTNLGLALYETTDKFKITDATAGLNKNMEKIDDAFGEIAQDMAPIVRGKQCAVSVAIGKYVLLMDSTITGKTDGAYKAAKAIPANTDIDGTYLTAVADGIANDLTDQIENLNIPKVHITKETISFDQVYGVGVFSISKSNTMILAAYVSGATVAMRVYFDTNHWQWCIINDNWKGQQKEVVYVYLSDVTNPGV